MPKSTKILFTLLIIFTIAGIILAILTSQGLLAQTTPEPGQTDVKSYPVTNLTAYTSINEKGECGFVVNWDDPKELATFIFNGEKIDLGDIEWHLKLNVGGNFYTDEMTLYYDEKINSSKEYTDWCGKDVKLQVETYFDGKIIEQNSFNIIEFKLNSYKFTNATASGTCPPSGLEGFIQYRSKGDALIHHLWLTWKKPTGNNCEGCGAHYEVKSPSGRIYKSNRDSEFWNDSDPWLFMTDITRNSGLGNWTVTCFDSASSDAKTCGSATINISALYPTGTMVGPKNKDDPSTPNEGDTSTPGGETGQQATGGEGIQGCKIACAEKQDCGPIELLDPICNGFCSFNCYILQLIAGLFNWAFSFLSNAIGLS